MSDSEWNEEGGASTDYQSPIDSGRGFGRGRGNANNAYGSSNGNGDSGDYDNGNDGGGHGRGGGGRRGRGRGGRGGGGGDRDGGRRNGDDNEDGGGYKGRKSDGGGDGEEDKPKPELYIPPEPTDDETEMFGGGITSGINFNQYDKISVKVTGEDVPPPVSSFEAAGLRNFVLDNVKKSGYAVPTPVQKFSLPIVMAGRDLISVAQTGSGKTAAFLIPMVNMLLSDPRELVLTSEQCQPQVVIISPTRELTIQIYNEARKFAHGSAIRCVVAYGGTASFHQAQQVLKGCHIVVATPGRLLDFVQRGRISFASVRFFVLDEADRMLDMGFMPDVEKMVNHESMVPKTERQTLMFSATFQEDVQLAAANFLKENYIYLTVGIVGASCTDVEQIFFKVDKFEKRKKLLEVLKVAGKELERTLVFVETKRSADFLATYLSDSDLATTSIHGDRLQREREEALADFKRGRMKILVATAVAARGLDIKDVLHVVNFDMPKSIDEYVHRIGRTGRVGNKGRATSLYDPDTDSNIAGPLVHNLKQAGQEVPDWLTQDAANGGGGGGGGSRGFGGHDVRKFDNNAGGGGGGQAEPEEDW